MHFDFESYNIEKTKATDAKLKSISSSATKLVRNAHSSPLRGCFVKFSKNQHKAEQWVSNIHAKLFDFIKDSNLSEEQKQSLLTFETFQADQKGPTSPTTLDQLVGGGGILGKLIFKQPFDFDSSTKTILEEVISDIQKYLGKFEVGDISTIDFSQSWKELPSTTVRGFPFHALGRDSDDKILQLGGSTFSSALEYFKSSNQNLTFPGYRIQGKPAPGPAKIRWVSVPAVSYQYINVGLYKDSMRRLKLAPMFAGWVEPNQRIQIIRNMLKLASDSKKKIIALDYSGFDTNIHPFLRDAANRIMLSCFNFNSALAEYQKFQSLYNNNQFAVLPDPNGLSSQQLYPGVALVSANYQLLSGVINTQHDGSLINAIIQGYIAKRLGFDLDWDLVLVLGDDAGFQVPETILDDMGYSGVLKEISNIVKELGFEVHPKKAYPTTQLIFLQKLWDVGQNLISVGTWARTISSFVFKENYPKRIPGIQSLPALEIIGQISMLNEAFSGGEVDLRDFAKTFVEEWLMEDDGLYWVINRLRDEYGSSFNGDVLFRRLVRMTGINHSQILDYFDKASYDHTSFSQLLEATNYEQVFHILPYLVNCSLKRRVDTSEGIEYFKSSFVTEPLDIDFESEGQE